MLVQINRFVQEKFPYIYYKETTLRGVSVLSSPEVIEKEKMRLISEWKQVGAKSELRQNQRLSAYKKYYQQIGTEFSKQLPPTETLILRCLVKGFFPAVNNIVDACNIAAVRFFLSMAVFDIDKFVGVPELRFSENGEKFQPIGRQEPQILDGGHVVLADKEKIISIFSFKDSDHTKVERSTQNVLLVGCHVDGIQDEDINLALSRVLELINENNQTE